VSRAAALRAAVRDTLPVALCYALLVALIFCPFTLGSGMSHETLLPWLSETRGALHGLWYPHDSMRVGMTLFFHLGWLLGEASGAGGSFVPYQIVHALLWWARGLLAYLILRRALPGWPVFHLAVGGLVILHGADTTLSWVGALNQQGTIVLALSACLALLRALQATSASERALATWAAAGLLALSLWSYESHVALACALPLLLARAAPGPALARVSCLAPWYSVLAVYLSVSARRYLWLRAASYQTSVLRDDASAGALLADLWFLLRGNLEFWRWGEALPRHAPAELLAGLAALTALAFAAALAIALLRRDGESLPAPRVALRFALLGTALAALALPAFLLLEVVRTLWRTQFLASLGGALALAAASAALAGLLPRRRAREAAFVLLVATIGAFGAHGALAAGAWQRALWERHRGVMLDLLRQAPDVAPRTVFVLTGVPADADPFHGDNQWFQTALRLAYPEREVYGVYLRDDGTPAPGAFATDRIPTAQALVFRHTAQGARLELAPPPDSDPAAWRGYAPRNRMLPGPASPRALRRYRAGAPP
jgi:hypothetical protein